MLRHVLKIKIMLCRLFIFCLFVFTFANNKKKEKLIQSWRYKTLAVIKRHKKPLYLFFTFVF